MLKRNLLLATVLVCSLGLVANVQPARAFDWTFGFGSGSRDDFYVSIGNYYGVPRSEVVYIADAGIPSDQVPVVFMISQRANIAPIKVARLRLSGLSWLEVVRYYSLEPSIFYVPLTIRNVGPPYGHAYGYYWNKPRSQWNTIVLADDDIINLVNLKFISSHTRLAPERVIELRSSGKTFVTINEEVKVKSKEKIKVEEKGEGVKVEREKSDQTMKGEVQVENKGKAKVKTEKGKGEKDKD